MLRRMLIIDEVATRRNRLQTRLQAAFYDVCASGSLREALSQLRDQPPDLVLLSGALTEGASVFDLLRRQAGQAGLPILALQPEDSARGRLKSLLAGASEVISPDAPTPLLMAQIRSLLRQSAPLLRDPRPISEEVFDGFCEPPQGPGLPGLIMVVTDEAAAPGWCDGLQPLIAPHRLMPLTQTAVLERRDVSPDAILLCAGRNAGENALGLLSDLLARRLPTGAPVIWVSAPEGAALAAAALDLGADAVLPAGFPPLEAATRLRRLMQRRLRNNARIRLLQDGLRLALTDPLTGLSNRRHALPALSRMLGEAGPGGSGCAVMLLDLDHFKQVNDTFGHAAGDDVLTEVARRLRSGLEPEDLIARYGGEEFLIAARLHPGRDALALADRLRAALALRPIPLPAERRSLPVTASIGLALSGPATCPAEEMLRRADEALLLAKRRGRNQVCLAHQIAA